MGTTSRRKTSATVMAGERASSPAATTRGATARMASKAPVRATKPADAPRKAAVKPGNSTAIARPAAAARAPKAALSKASASAPKPAPTKKPAKVTKVAKVTKASIPKASAKAALPKQAAEVRQAAMLGKAATATKATKVARSSPGGLAANAVKATQSPQSNRKVDPATSTRPTIGLPGRGSSGDGRRVRPRISQSQALENTRALLEAKHTRDRETAPWQALGGSGDGHAIPASGIRSDAPDAQAGGLHEGETDLDASQGNIRPGDDRKRVARERR